MGIYYTDVILVNFKNGGRRRTTDRPFQRDTSVVVLIVLCFGACLYVLRFDVSVKIIKYKPVICGANMPCLRAKHGGDRTQVLKIQSTMLYHYDNGPPMMSRK